MKRNVILLSKSQAALTTGTSMILTSSAIVGMDLARNKSLVTLPLAKKTASLITLETMRLFIWPQKH
jgi:hypothetical protein